MGKTGQTFRRCAKLALAALLALPAATETAIAQPRELAPLLKAERDVIPDEYIVVFNIGRSPLFRGDVREAIIIARRQSLAAQELVRRLGGVVKYQYNSALVGFSARLPATALEAVRAAPGVAHVETVRRVFGDVVRDLSLVGRPAGLDRIDRRLLPLDDAYTYNDTGANVHVYVIDSGIFAQHTQFQNRLSDSRNFVPVPTNSTNTPNPDNWNDCTVEGHGTRVASIIGGKDFGVASGITLHAMRVFDCVMDGNTSLTLAAVDHVRQNAIRPAVVNMSLSAYAIPGSPDAMEIAVRNSIKGTAAAPGITHVVSAGNDPSVLLPAGPDPTKHGEDACVKTPARLGKPTVPTNERTITVGATYPATDDRWQWSNWGDCVDLFAPGYQIMSAIPSCNVVTGKCSGDNGMSGTSLAAPHVAGVAARYLETHTTALPAEVWAAILNAANVTGTTVGTQIWSGVGNAGSGSPNVMLHWGSHSDGTIDGDPHITTVDGVRYDFQGAGEFVALRDTGLEIQTRQAPVATATTPLPDLYTGLTNCVSVNTAVATRVGKHRVTLQPNLKGAPDPSGLQLRIDGQLASAGPNGLYLSGGGRIASTPAGGIDIAFPDGSELLVTPGWWADHATWFLNVSVLRTPAREGIMGAVPSGSWLPALPNGASLGPMPAGLAQRHVDLNQKFMDAWRVSDSSSLFDYAPGTSTATFTRTKWPPDNGQCNAPEAGPRPTRPLENIVAQRLCYPLADKGRKANCVFDVTVTGAPVFAKTYLNAERVLRSSTRVTVYADKDVSAPGEPVVLTAVVERRTSARERAPVGAVQFLIDGRPASDRIRLDRGSRASWSTTRLGQGAHKFAAQFFPRGHDFLPSGSLERVHTVSKERRYR